MSGIVVESSYAPYHGPERHGLRPGPSLPGPLCPGPVYPGRWDGGRGGVWCVVVVVVVLQPAVFKVANHDVDLGAFDGLGDEGKVPEVGGGGRGLLGGGRVLDGGVLLVLLALGGEGRRRGRGGGRGREATRLMRVHCGGCVGVVVCVWFWLLVSSPLVFSPWLRERMVSIGSLGGVCVFCSVRTTYESVFALVCRWWSPDQQRGEGSSGRVSRVVVGAQRVGGGREDDDRDVCGGGRPGMLAVAGVMSDRVELGGGSQSTGGRQG